MKLVAVCAAALCAVGVSGHAAAARPRAAVKPVPSLTPEATEKLWRKLVSRPRARFSDAADCRPFRAVFYGATDWRRLATKLAALGSPCAEYYISVPPLVSDKTQPRGDEAWRIRALGPNFHALSEVHWGAWSQWVTANGADGLRRLARRHVGGERVLDRGTPRRRERTRERARVRARPLHGRRDDGARRGMDHRHEPADHRALRLPGPAPRLVQRRRLLERHEQVCQRLVARTLRRRAQLRGARYTARRAPRHAERLPAARAHTRPRGAVVGSERAVVPRGDVQPARERRVEVRSSLRVDVRSLRPDGALCVGAGLRVARRRARRLCLVAEESRRAAGSRLRCADGRDPRSPRGGNSRLG